MNTQIIKKGRMPGSAMKSGAITALVVGSIAVVIGVNSNWNVCFWKLCC